MSLSNGSKSVKEILADAQAKVSQLQNINPFLIDLSLRENPVGARVGQTLADKLLILPKIREFGFQNILLGTLDYSIPDELEVDDDFMIYLRDHEMDMTGCFAFTAMGIVGDDGQFKPDPSQEKLRDYKVPNTLHEIYISKAGRGDSYSLDTLKRSLPASIEWLNKHIGCDSGVKPRIIINVVDGYDAFAEDREDAHTVCEILSLLAEQPIEGVSFEDDRGTYLPFQVGAYTAIARQILPGTMKLLVHIHAGAGFENAAVIEALLNGADGVWGGLPKRAAIIGHASLGELIANLVRVGNSNMQEYRLDRLLSLATRLQELDEEERVPDDLPILGHNAYRLPLTFFKQKNDRFMDLDPEAIGGRYRYRICPLVSDKDVIAGRLAEIVDCQPEEFSQDVLTWMIALMRRDLRAGTRIVYDEPKNLLELYARATACCVSKSRGGS